MDFLSKNKIYIILFSSNDPISSTITCFESFCLRHKCIFSHSGILFHSEILLPEFKFSICNPEDSFLVIESTLSGRLNDDVYNTCGKVKFGVQIRLLNELIESYSTKNGTKIAVAEIEEKIADLSSKFTNILQKYITRKYEYLITNLLIIHLPISSIESESVFCSELVYRILKELRINIRKKHPKKVSPNSLLKYLKLKELVYIVA